MFKGISDKTVNLWEIYISALLVGLGIFEAGHLAGLFLDKSISFCGHLILGMLAVFALVVGLFLLKSRKYVTAGIRWGVTKGTGLAILLFGLLLFGQIVYICGAPLLQTTGDITLETVNSFLITDEIYSVSPLTGKAYTGAPLRYKILCVPTIYTLLCRWTRWTPEILVGRVIPVLTLCSTYIVYYLLSGSLFGKEKTEKRIWFLIFAAVIFWLCDSAVYLDGYGALHGGYLGTTIRNNVLIPFLLYAVLEKRWYAVVLCVFAEACLVWTFWGLGVCIMVCAVYFALGMIGRVARALRKEGGSCE